MKTITISLSDKTADETVTAEYFQIEDGWITFKTEDHKAVVAYPENRVTRIKSEAEESGNVHVAINTGGYLSAEAREAAMKAALSTVRWGRRS